MTRYFCVVDVHYKDNTPDDIFGVSGEQYVFATFIDAAVYGKARLEQTNVKFVELCEGISTSPLQGQLSPKRIRLTMNLEDCN